MPVACDTKPSSPELFATDGWTTTSNQYMFVDYDDDGKPGRNIVLYTAVIWLESVPIY